MARSKGGRRASKHPSNTTPNNSFPRPFAEFTRYVDEQAKRHVEDFSENSKHFIPLPVLRQYWTPARISKVQNVSHPPLPLNIESIRNGYLRTFSTLVYCGQVASLEHFTSYNLNDDRLPLEGRPDQWPNAPLYDKLFQSIFKDQWLFFPLIFADLEDRRLHADRVLPILSLGRISHERVTHGDAAIIQKMTIHDSCNLLQSKDQKDQPTQNTFVLKTYHRARFQKLYENEATALRMLKNSPHPNVITYYGSFRQNGSYNIILEYANGGDLAEYLKKTPRPKGTEVERFWKSLSRCFKGLECVHHLRNADGNYVHGIHEDIKPENILLFKGPSGSPYDFVPKIADFGLFTHVRESKANSSDAMGIDRFGSQLYSSPESSHAASHQENGPNTINNKSDIFSFGAVLSDACAWVKGGSEEKVRYLELRKAFHQNVRTIRGSDYEGCFHDGETRLPIVDEMHASIRDHCQSVNDNITPRVLELTEEHMLLSNANDRFGATQLTKKLDEILYGSNHETPELPPATQEPGARPGMRERGQSLAELGEMIARRQSDSSWNARRSLDSVDADIRKLADDLSVNVPGRHHLFFIDDSTSMRKHAKLVEEAFLALLHVTRQLEGHKVELRFASNPLRVHRKRRMKKLAQLVAHREYRRAPDLIKSCFGRLVDNVILPRLPIWLLGININFFVQKPTSIYVFTDGNWGDDEEDEGGACGVEWQMERLSRELDKRNLDENHVSFHFVRFGDDADGKRRLSFLDGSSWSEGRDNIDVKSVSSPLRSIVIGPISRANDRSDEDDDL